MTTSSRHFTRPSPAAWAWGWRFAVGSSRHTRDNSRTSPRMNRAAPSFISRCLCNAARPFRPGAPQCRRNEVAGPAQKREPVLDQNRRKVLPTMSSAISCGKPVRTWRSSVLRFSRATFSRSSSCTDWKPLPLSGGWGIADRVCLPDNVRLELYCSIQRHTIVISRNSAHC